MKLRSTALLIAVLVLLCAGYWWSLRWEKETERRTIESKRVFAFEADAVKRISIQQEDGAPSVGVRVEGDTWQIVQPYELAAHHALWNRCAEHFANLISDRIIADDPDSLEEFGLDQPLLTVQAETAEGGSHQVTFGTLDPYQKDRYARLDEGPVVMVPDAACFELNRSLDLLRHMYLMTNADAGVRRLEYARIRPRKEDDDTPDAPDAPAELSGAEESVAVVVEWRKGVGWTLTEPEEGPADQAMVAELSQEILFAVGRDFVDAPESLDDYGLAPPRCRITAFLGEDGDAQTVYFGNLSGEGEKGGLFVKREGEEAVFQIDAQVFTLLPSRPEAFLEKRILSREDEITRFEYTRGEEHVLAEKDAEGVWRLLEPVQEAADPRAVDGFVEALQAMRGKHFYAEAWPSFGLDEPTVEIAITFADDPEPARIVVGDGDRTDERSYVLQDTGAITTLSKQEVVWLKKTSFYFREKSLFSFDTESAREVRLTFEGTSYRFVKGSRRWDVAEPAGMAWESQTDMDALLDAVNPVEVWGCARSEPLEDPAPYGLAEPILRFEVDVVGEDGESRTTLGPASVGGLYGDATRYRFATLPDYPGVFYVEQNVIDSLREVVRGIRETQPAQE
ncbi:MAG: DUF4340 domain-containing protein [bacterium]|nr:DUF4340 domain-containing protein [bacterium]